MLRNKIVLCLSLLACGSAMAVNRYYSPDGSWKPEGDETIVHTTLTEAINAASEGDVVYIQDGTVIDSGTVGGKLGYISSRIRCDKAITISSYSGDADESQGHGVYLVGAKSNPSAATPKEMLGENSIRCLASAGNAKFVGFICTDGCTSQGMNGCIGDSAHGGGGAMVTGDAVFENCIFRNNVGGYGAAVLSTSTNHMPVLRNCVMTNNTIVYRATACGRIRYENCLVGWNQSTASQEADTGGIRGGAAEYPATVINCTIIGNTIYKGAAGGVQYANCQGSVIRDNSNCHNHGGGANTCVLVDCEIIGNQSDDGGEALRGYGGGLYNCTATNCAILANRTTGTKSDQGAQGAGAYGCWLVGCDISCNTSKYNGAGICIKNGNYCYNCTITNNYSDYGPGGVFSVTQDSSVEGGTLCNCLIAYNTGACPVGYAAFAAGASGNLSGVTRGAPLVLENCTVVSNMTVTGNQRNKPFGGLYNVKIVNTISWDNGTANNGCQDDVNYILSAQNSCCSVLTDTAKFPACITDNPKFDATKAYQLSAPSPCRDAGKKLTWMTDKGDVRSKDLSLNPRLAGDAPDMGCYERRARGMTIKVR